MDKIHIELRCRYPRIAKPLGCTGFMGIILGERDNIFKLLLTFRSDKPGGRVMEVHVLLDRYLELQVNDVVCFDGCYVLCVLQGQQELFKRLNDIIPVDKYLIGKGERAWLIYECENYNRLSLQELWSDEHVVNKCPYVNPSYVIGLRNYLLAHSDVKEDLLNRVKTLEILLDCSEE